MCLTNLILHKKMKLPLFIYLSLIHFNLKGTCQKVLEESFIDTKRPIIITDTTNSEDEGHFGYSISGTSKVSYAKIYVGAPGSTRIKDDRGSVWECEINLKEVGQDFIKCSLWNSQSADSKVCCGGSRGKCLEQYTSKMWLGGSISTVDNNNFVTCGHRWSSLDPKNDQVRRLNGLCYHSKEGQTMPLAPPLLPEDQYQTLRRNQSYSESTFLWVYSQFGFSSALDKSKTHLMIGAPGYFEWRGNAILVNLNDKFQQCQQKTKFNSLLQANTKTTAEAMDYLGYQISSGYYNPHQLTTFAVGAPRGQGIKHLSGYVSIVQIKFNRINSQETIRGMELGSYFGSVTAFADVNGDFLEELIVGAPFYSSKLNSGFFDEGCVFIYFNNVLQEQLCPSTESGSRFGSAIANLGDINHDTFQDIAIGAPGSLKGQGEVYIYYGDKGKLGARKNNPQRIQASEIRDQAIKGFGSTLLGNIDLDDNGTPDIIIGAWPSNKIFIYRTRPYLALERMVTYFQDNGLFSVDKFKRDGKVLRVKLCVTSFRSPKIDGEIDIQIEAQLDASEERFRFENKAKSFQFPLRIIIDGNPVCADVLINRERELEAQNPSTIRIKWRLFYNNTLSYVWDVRSISLTLTSHAKLTSGNDKFCTWCPKSTEMFYEDSLFVANDNCDEDGKAECTSKLKVFAKFAEIIERNSSEYVIGSKEMRYLDVSVGNEGETAYFPVILLSVKFSKPELEINTKVNILSGGNQCQSESVKGSEGEVFTQGYRCSDPLHRGQFIRLQFEVSLKDSLTAMSSVEKIEFLVKAYPKTYPKQTKDSLPVVLVLLSDVQLVVTKLDNERKDDIHSSNKVFQNSYVVANAGISPIKVLNFKFQIPYKFYENGNEQDALIIYEPKPSHRIFCNSPMPQGFPRLPYLESSFPKENPTSVNDTNLTPGISRRRRDTKNNMDDNPLTIERVVSSTGKTFNVDCQGSQKWKCVMITCKMLPETPLLGAQTLIVELSMAFTNNITNEVIPLDSTIIVTTRVKIWTFDEEMFKQASSVTILQAKPDQSLPALLVFAAGIIGLIIFLLITFCLFKCGFFRRKTKESLDTLKAQAEEEDLISNNFNLPQDSDEIN